MKKLYLLIALATIVAAVNAAVFVYYPLSITLQPSKPAVYFVLGTNANQNDIMYGVDGNRIVVIVDSAGAQAWITVHPTYQRTYYRDVLRVVNQDNVTYTVWLIIDNPISVSGNLTSAKLYVKDASGNTVKTVDLSQTGSQTGSVLIGQISGGAYWRIDLEFQITGYGDQESPSEAPILSDTSASLRLVYTPSNETPP